ncbi:MAG: YheU family protein [SAR324 cluster bacterium]|uniref:YheU family protein n=1 Tax=SAR324 cluster bacterium TaxID=2024889 RepID=A0A7X9FP42_9DELT|nr:YheU family protein [SAR324 cluster bacterium]
MEIPPEMLSPEILKAMLEEFVLREGTDYGHDEYTLEEKVSQVRKQLKEGKLRIVFNEEDETFDLLRKY